MRSGDWFIILLLVCVFLLWGATLFRHWFAQPSVSREFRAPQGDKHFEPNEVTELLEDAGFDVVGSKARIPILMTLNDRTEFQSRLYVDFFVHKRNKLYLVKVARDRKPLQMTGSAIRDELLPYYLLYPEAAGVLYVDTDSGKIKKFTFHIEV